MGNYIKAPQGLTFDEKCGSFSSMEELIKMQKELERTKTELAILYEISNAMHTTLKLDEILYIILTGVTAHTGLGFNRAMLFLVNEKEALIEGKMGIGPESGEEANRIWTNIEQAKMDLDDLIGVYTYSNHATLSGFHKQVNNLKFPISEQSTQLLSIAALEGMPLHLTGENIQTYQHDPIIEFLKSKELALVPLKSKDKVNGLILADNFITGDPITKDDMRMLIMLSNQAGLAIENSRLYEKTELRAHSDYLTGLWNHGYFQFLLHAEWEKAKINRLPLSLIILDIDDFKVYNDGLGHQAGDSVLKEMAALLKKQCRKMDYACRYGGEEFAIILPQTDAREALLIAERLRENVGNYPFIKEEILPAKRLTISLGLSTFPQNADTPQDLINAADKALYQAKRNGKNNTARA